jgi:hypothetical protein
LWSEEVEAWSLKYPNEKLQKSEKKKQDIIYGKRFIYIYISIVLELYRTEKHHCQVIIVLQQVNIYLFYTNLIHLLQAYQVRLREEKILSDKELDELVPAVLDGLLDFHLCLIRRIRQRQKKATIVDSISDVIFEEVGALFCSSNEWCIFSVRYWRSTTSCNRCLYSILFNERRIGTQI